MSAVTIGSWRAVIGAFGFVAVASIRGQAPWRYRLPPRWLAIGAVGVAGSQIAFFEAVSRTGVAVGTLVAIGTGPVAAGAIDWLVHRHRPHRRWLLGVVVALAGVVLLSGGAAEVVVWSGVAFGVLAGCAIPLFGFGAQGLMRDRPLLPAMATVVGSGAVLLLPSALVSADAAFGDFEAAATVVYLGAGDHDRRSDPVGRRPFSASASASCWPVTLLEPAVAATLAMTVLDEPLTAGLAAGICLVITGVAITSFNPTTHSDLSQAS